MLEREEYIEQAYFFRVFRERLEENVPSQEILSTLQEEILATTKLPMAIDFLHGEIMLTGRVCEAMERLPHYFVPFQTFVMARAEDDHSRFDQRVALEILEREAEYRAGEPTMPGLFFFQFESLSRNRLGYDGGMRAMAGDPFFDERWTTWIARLQRQLGTHDLASFIYGASEQYRIDRQRHEDTESSEPALFGAQDGRIARASIGRDPLHMFAALQRQLGYPRVPRPTQKAQEDIFHPVLEQRLQHIEKRLKLLESETREGLDLSEFYANPPRLDDNGNGNGNGSHDKS